MNKKSSSKMITTGFMMLLIATGAALVAVLILSIGATVVQEADARVNDGAGAEHASGNNCAELGDRCAFNNQFKKGQSSAGTVPPSGSYLDCPIDGGGTSSPGREEFNGAYCDDMPVAPIP
jgi:uncharacterized membrane protein